MGTPRVSRRGLLGYAGTTGLGALTGAGLVVAAGPDAPAGPATPTSLTPVGATLPPWGPHQPGVAQAPPAVLEVVALDLRPGVDREALGRLMRLWTGDVEALAAGRPAPGDPAPWLSVPGADLTLTVGVGPGALGPDRFGAGPDGFTDVPPMVHDRLEERWSGGDLCVLVAGRDTTVSHAVRRMVADARPFARLRWTQQGAWNGTAPDGTPQTGRNLFGQVDGSANPRPGTEPFDRTVWIPEGRWAGGTTLVLRRIRMDLDTWDELTREEQERSVGRRLADGAPLTGGGETDDVDLAARDEQGRPVVALDAHVRRSHPSLHGGRRIFRKGASWTREVPGPRGPRLESGLLFSSYQADLADQFVPLQRSLDERDSLNEWTTAVGSAVFAVLPGFEQGDWLGRSLLA